MNVKLRNSVIKDNKRGRGDGRENKLMLLPYINNKNTKKERKGCLLNPTRIITNYISPKN